MTELFKCSRCGKMFKTEHGVKVHKGRKHKKKTAKQEIRRVQVLKAAKKYKQTEKGKRTAAKYERSVKGKKRRKKYRNSTQGIQAALRNKETRRQKDMMKLNNVKKRKKVRVLLLLKNFSSDFLVFFFLFCFSFVFIKLNF